jgi:hypothetical protein
MYGEQTTKDLIYSYTPEVGGGEDGFWPPVSRIIPLCQENMHQNLMAAFLAGAYATTEDISPSIIENKNGFFFFKLQRLGLEDGATYTVSIEPLSDAIDTISGPMSYSDLDLLESVTAAFTFSLRDDIVSGEEVKYIFKVENGLTSFSDTINKIYGTPLVIFSDSANNFDNWSSDKWNNTDAEYHSPASSITDSPFGQYGNYEYNTMTLIESIDLTDEIYASLGFWAKWDIEAGYDYVQVMVSDDDGASWMPVQGKYTHPGNNNQAYGEPLYDGVQETWVKEEINLEPFLGKTIKIRFVLRSDSFVVGDGFFWDDMKVTVVDVLTGLDDEKEAIQSDNYKPVLYPNPASSSIRLEWNSESTLPDNSTLMIFDSKGQVIFLKELTGNDDSISWDVSSWSSGLYFYTIIANGIYLSSGKLMVR